MIFSDCSTVVGDIVVLVTSEVVVIMVVVLYLPDA